MMVEEVPFITTPDHVTLAMLTLAGVGATDHLIDLGSGDGRIVITAARRFGASGLGVEIDPALVTRSRDNARQAGVSQRVEFRTQDLFDTPLSSASVITMYLLPQVNMALRPRLLALAPGTRIVSHDWDLGDWRADRTLTVAVPDKAVGLEKFSRLHLWTVPARLHGLWCGDGGVALRVAQQHQQVGATLDSGSDSRGFSGRIDGTRLRLLGAGGAGWSAVAEADGLRIGEVSAGVPLQLGQRLRPAVDESCAGAAPAG
jgi:SAM-dependent methyltransferase